MYATSVTNIVYATSITIQTSKYSLVPRLTHIKHKVADVSMSFNKGGTNHQLVKQGKIDINSKKHIKGVGSSLKATLFQLSILYM